MLKIDLTANDYQVLDPTGQGRSWIARLEACNELKPEPPSPLFRLRPEEMLDRYQTLMEKLSRNMDSRYLEFNNGHVGNYMPQGGCVPWQTICSILSEYYEAENIRKRPIHPVILRGRDFLIRQIRQKMSFVGGPQYVGGLGITGTHSGLPVFGTKGSFDAETVGAGTWIHLYPATPGTRYMRGKPRTIFMDACPNVRAIENYLSSVKKWLVTHFPQYFSTWTNPYRARNVIITEALRRRYSSVEGDYKGMDIRFRKQIAEEILFPIYEVLLPDSFLSFAAHVEQMFSQPLFMGTTLWTGEHTLFSGQAPTNDFETLYSVCLLIGLLLEFRVPGFILALGDDLSLLVKKEASRDIFGAMISVSESTGLIMHPEGTKSRVRDEYVTFCREYFSLQNGKSKDGIILGQYPSLLTLNSIVQPEKPQHSVAAMVAADLQRMDNLRFNREFVPFLQFVRRYYEADLTRPAQELPRDWWARLYGEDWNPSSSASFCFFANTPCIQQTPEPLSFRAWATT